MNIQNRFIGHTVVSVLCDHRIHFQETLQLGDIVNTSISTHFIVYLGSSLEAYPSMVTNSKKKTTTTDRCTINSNTYNVNLPQCTQVVIALVMHIATLAGLYEWTLVIFVVSVTTHCFTPVATGHTCIRLLHYFERAIERRLLSPL